MAQKFGSPGVFTTEIDQSFLDQGTVGVGAVVLGGAQKGPAMLPIRVSNFQEFVERFGSLDVELQMPYAARNYLKNATVLNVVRILGHDDGTSVAAGYTVGGITGITDRSGSNSVTGSVLAVIHHSGTSTVPQISGVPLDADRFVFKISTFAVTASFLTGSDDYIEKVLNTDPTRYDTDKHYLAQVFKYSRPAASASWHLVGASGSMNSFAKNFAGGSTPWVKSQPLGGMEYEMFKFHTLGHGRYTMDDVKISVQNVRPSVNVNSTKYGSFDVVVRRFGDTDLRPVVLETFANLSLDPEDRNYIGRRIGDQLVEFDTTNRKFVATGDFRNRSKYIRVELNKNNGAPAEALPWGFRGYEKVLFDLSASAPHTVPSMRYVGNMKDGNGTFNTNIHFGVQFLSGGVADRMWTHPVLTANPNLTGSDTDFSLKHLSASYENGNQRYQYNTAITNYSPVFLSASVQKFSMPLFGGFDGFDYRLVNPFDIANANDETDLEVVSFQRGLDTISNPDEVSFNLLTVPGIHNLKVVDKARTLVNDRTDAMFIMDVSGATVNEVVNNVKSREMDDNYTACYYPDVKIDDPVNNRIVRVSPSTVVMGAYAYSDRVGQVFFAPAGLNRGGLEQFGVVDVTDRLNYTDRSTLYDNRVNPIATFPDQGIVVFGQKTLQVAASALDRVNVRRLLIHAKQTVSQAAKTLVFEPNNPSTYQRFLNKVNPILEKIRQDQGLERFQVVMDTNLNTPDVVDRNVMRGKIFLQPTKVAEFIDLSFIITNAGVQFSS